MMDSQTIIVLIIVFAALAYVGQIVWRKAKATVKNSSTCASACGCAGKEKRKTAKV